MKPVETPDGPAAARASEVRSSSRARHSLISQRTLSEVLPLALALGAGVICYGLFWNRGIWLSVVGYSVSPAERVLNGEIPYRDFLYNYTPGVLWLNAALMKAFSTSLVPINAGLFAFKLATLAALFGVARRVMPPWPSALPPFLTLAWLGHHHIFNVHPTQYSILFVLTATLFALNFERTNNGWWSFAAGAAVGAVFALKYNAGLALLGTGAIGLGLSELLRTGERGGWRIRRSLAAIACYAAGMCAALAPLILYLAAHRALGPMISHFAHHAAEYSEERTIALPLIRATTRAVEAVVFAVTIGFALAKSRLPLLCGFVIAASSCAALLMLAPGAPGSFKGSATAAIAYLGPGAFGAAAAWIAITMLRRSSVAARKARIETKGNTSEIGAGEPERRILIIVLFALGAYLEIYPRADFYHIDRVLPVVFLSACVLAWRVIGVCASRMRCSVPRLFAATAVAPLVLVICIGIRDTWVPQFKPGPSFVDDTRLALPTARGMRVSSQEAAMIAQLIRMIDANSQRQDPIFSFARRGAGFYFFAQRRNPTRLLWWDSVGIPAGDRNSTLESIRDGVPKLVLLQQGLDDQDARGAVAARYALLGQVEDIEIYKAK